MKKKGNFKVLAINKECEEIQKWFDTEEEAKEYAKVCEEHKCDCVRIADARNW